MQRVDVLIASVEDIRRLTEIDEVSFPEGERWSSISFSGSIESADEIILSAVDADTGMVAGYAAVSYVLDEANLNKIAVDPEYRQKGIGSLLLKKMEEYLPAQVSVYNLEVREGSRNAVSMYLRSGYEIIGKRRRFYRNPDEDALLMTKRKVMI